MMIKTASRICIINVDSIKSVKRLLFMTLWYFYSTGFRINRHDEDCDIDNSDFAGDSQ